VSLLALASLACTGRSIDPSDREVPDASLESEPEHAPVVVHFSTPPPVSNEAKPTTLVSTAEIEQPIPEPTPSKAKPAPKPESPPEEPVPETKHFADAYPATPPSPGAKCHEVLDALGVTYKVAPAAVPGIVDPVLVRSPLRGVRFRYVNARRSDPLMIDCRFAIHVARAMDVLLARGVEEFQHVGTYVYRCFGPGEPPDCHLSQHAMGMALDFVAFTVGERTYRVANDFVVKRAGDPLPTCDAPRKGPGDALLKDIVCTWWDSHAFRVLLTPNYNEAHRTHIHVDMAEGSAPGPSFTLEGLTDGVDPAGRKNGD